MCQSSVLVPATNSSRRPAEFNANPGVFHTPTGNGGLTTGGWAGDVRDDQPPLGAPCQMCHSCSSLPQMNSSRRPSALAAIAGPPLLKKSVPGGVPCDVQL